VRELEKTVSKSFFDADDRPSPLGCWLLQVHDILTTGSLRLRPVDVDRRQIAHAEDVRMTSRRGWLTSASASISTFQRGSRNPMTTTIVDAGHVAKHLRVRGGDCIAVGRARTAR
jgi:hypothetical protein